MPIPDNSPLESLPNLGPKSPEWLRNAGITTVGELKNLGPSVAFQMVKAQESRVSLNLLWALAAGLKGHDWRELTDAQKARLRKDVET